MSSTKMEIHAKISLFLGILAILMAAPAIALDATFKGSLEHFSYNMFRELVKSNGNKNIIYSPFSTHTCLAMVRMGADGETATEMDRVLGFTGQTAESVCDNYYSLLAHYENSGHVHVANKLYVMKGHELQDNYSEVLSKKFFSSPDFIDFANSDMASHTINKWVETNTNNRIKDLIQSDDLNAHTRLVLINAIHFHGEWLEPFDGIATEEADFFTNETSSVKVQMMQSKSGYQYAYFPELNASAVRLPYIDTDLSMLIVVPNSRTGLSEMQEKLTEIKLESLTNKLSERAIYLHLPKFEVEYEIEMTQPLEKLGMEHVFTNADFGKMLKSSEPLEVSKVVHKAIIKVTERGTEAAGATAAQVSLRFSHEDFMVDRPFYYAIVNNDNIILFQGNVVKF